MKKPSLDVSKFQGQVLDAILATKRQELKQAVSERPLAELQKLVKVARAPRDFSAALTQNGGTSVIAEVKKASPSRGEIARDWDPAAMASSYVKGGAAAISCLTDQQYFQGNLSFLELIGQRLEEEGQAVPVFRKDFIFDEYQVWESRAAGADAFLLIMSVLSDEQYKCLAAVSRDLNMQILVEVHDETELERALALDDVVIGVNNRNLKTFHTDIDTTRRLREFVPSHRILVGESGIKTAKDVQSMAEIGCDAILVGETFSKLPQSRRERKVREFVAAGIQERVR